MGRRLHNLSERSDNSEVRIPFSRDGTQETENGKPVALIVVGCVDYQYASSTNRHRTGFIQVAYVDKVGVTEAGSNLVLDQLLFKPAFAGGEYAY